MEAGAKQPRREENRVWDVRYGPGQTARVGRVCGESVNITCRIHIGRCRQHAITYEHVFKNRTDLKSLSVRPLVVGSRLGSVCLVPVCLDSVRLDPDCTVSNVSIGFRRNTLH